MTVKKIWMSSCALVVLACAPVSAPTDQMTYPTIGSIETSLPGLISDDAKVENLGGSFGWAEGPLWIEEGGYLLFTDVPGNTIWRFKEGEGLSEWMTPSGLDGPIPDTADSPGANGLIRLRDGRILAADHGTRRLYTTDPETKTKTTLVDNYDGKLFNSPNDATEHDTGIIYFTDPPYGLKNQDNSPVKALDFNGVYALYPDGKLITIDTSLTRPNGIILSPDQRRLYVANSDASDAKWMSYPVAPNGDVGPSTEILNVTDDVARGELGLPDGMAIDIEGRLYATGPGGVLILSPEGNRLGLIRTGKAVANVTFGGADFDTLYLTSSDILTRVKTETRGFRP